VISAQRLTEFGSADTLVNRKNLFHIGENQENLGGIDGTQSRI
jgi:hypothetical protein